jgi:hypothetical protein
MVRIEALIAWGSLAGFVLLMVLVALALSRGVPKAVSCVDSRPAGYTPAVIVRVTSDRNGHILKRNLFGCTFYSYEPPRRD